MIKLNNKNITYVALADSNNSLKAPKEIWYADSSNSVKLVYRRKDALIEGEDYEKYHWLNGDGSAYIDTLHSASEDLDWATKVADLTDGKALFWDRDGNGYAENMNVMIARTNDYRIGVRIANNSSEILLNPFPSSFIVQTNGASITIDGQSYSIIKNAGFNRNIKLFQSLPFADTNGVKCAYFRFIDTNSITTQNLIPCKLLKPVPKWLDANGIRRQVGECGMIDLVSGKFYGNVNSVGTFTVENYYERKEWLVANIYETTGINTMCDLPINSDTFEFRIIMQSENPINIGHIKNQNYWYLSDALTKIKVWNTVNRTTDFTSNIGSNDMTFKSTSSEFTINNIQVTKYGFPAKYKTFFNNRPNGNATVYNSPITVNNKERYIPCTLTMDLPASMDANNIARTKGTSGMWDLVSDKFYGNVANSGTFKAVNLAEGVDYEVHQWLVAEIYPRTAMMWIPVNSSDFSFIKENGNIVANLVHFTTSGYVYYTQTAGMDVLSVWDNTNGVFVMSKTVGSTMEFNSTSQGLSVNNTNITQYGFPVSRITFQTSSGTSNIVTTKTSAINVDGVERYIPVKLLKSIPSKYDANGIARQAGECGMYDTVNDVFYGNVASNGTFTVSDDE